MDNRPPYFSVLCVGRFRRYDMHLWCFLAMLNKYRRNLTEEKVGSHEVFWEISSG